METDAPKTGGTIAGQTAGKDLAAAAFLTLLVLVFFSPLLFEDKTIFYRDFTGIVYPAKHFISKSFRGGVLPLWNPAAFNGEPFLAQMVPGVLYPLNLIFFLGDFTTAFNWFYVAQYALLTFSTYALARYWETSVVSALCAAATAFLSGFALSLSGTTTTFFSAVWLPATFLCAQKYLVGRKTRFFPCAVLCLACQALGGGTEVCVMTVLLLYAHAVFLAPRESRGREILRRSLLLAANVVLSLGLAAPQLLPTYALIKESSVRSEGFDFEHHSIWSLRPSALPSLILPDDVGRFLEQMQVEKVHFHSIHMGLFAAFFLCAGILFFGKDRKIVFWVAAFATGVFFALGKYNPLYRYFFEWIPFFKKFRFPEKFYFAAAIAQVFPVAFVADALLRALREKTLDPRRFFAFLATFCAAAIAIGFWQAGKNPAPSLVYLLVFGAACFALYSGRLSEAGWKTVLLVLVLLDLSLRNYALIPVIDRKFYDEPPAAATKIGEDKDLFRVYTGKIRGDPNEITFAAGANALMRQIALKERLWPYRGMIYGISYPNGLLGNALQLDDASLWAEIFEKSPPEKRLRILKRSAVKYWIDGDALQEERAVDDPPAPETPLRTFDDALPRVFLAPGARLGKEPYLLNTYFDESFDPRAEVLLSEDVPRTPKDGFSGSVRVTHYGPNRVSVQTRQNGDAFLVLLDSYFPGWTATADGKPERVLRANHFFRAVKLGAGEHVVEFSFTPAGFREGLLVCGATLAVMLVSTAFVCWRAGVRR